MRGRNQETPWNGGEHVLSDQQSDTHTQNNQADSEPTPPEIEQRGSSACRATQTVPNLHNARNKGIDDFVAAHNSGHWYGYAREYIPPDARHSYDPFIQRARTSSLTTSGYRPAITHRDVRQTAAASWSTRPASYNTPPTGSEGYQHTFCFDRCNHHQPHNLPAGEWGPFDWSSVLIAHVPDGNGHFVLQEDLTVAEAVQLASDGWAVFDGHYNQLITPATPHRLNQFRQAQNRSGTQPSMMWTTVELLHYTTGLSESDCWVAESTLVPLGFRANDTDAQGRWERIFGRQNDERPVRRELTGLGAVADLPEPMAQDDNGEDAEGRTDHAT